MSEDIIKNEHTESVSCLVCNSKRLDQSNEIRLRNSYKMGKCLDCGFVFSQPRPSINFLIDYYNSISSIRFDNQTSASALRDSKKIHQIINKSHKGARKILEVGCSTGYYLKGLELRGYEVCGSELSSDAVNLAKEWYGLEAYAAEFPPNSHFGKYDVIIIHHVIEHVLNPKEFLAQASKFLNDNGIFLLETPNVRSMGIRLFGKNYPVFCPPGHLNFFSQKTLEASLPSGHTPIVSRTASENGYVLYNCLNAFLAAIRLKTSIDKVISKKVEIKSAHPTQVSFNRKYFYQRIAFRISKAVQVLLFPLFKILGAIGLGENVCMVSQLGNKENPKCSED